MKNSNNSHYLLISFCINCTEKYFVTYIQQLNFIIYFASGKKSNENKKKTK